MAALSTGAAMTAFDPNDFLTLHEIVAAARRNLPGDIWHYVAGGTETETSMRRNRLAIEALALRPRVLNDVSAVSARSRFLGRDIRLPVALAPIGGLESLVPEGGAASARGAARFGVPMFLSSVAQPDLESVAAAAPEGFRVFQLYVRGDGAWIDGMVRRAADAGYAGFCITVDTQAYSRRERDIARRFIKPWRAADPSRHYQGAFGWEEVKRFRDTHRIPFLLKGIMTPEDAEAAARIGVDHIYVSNHGGRQLDATEGALDALREIAPVVAALRADRRRRLLSGHGCREGTLPRRRPGGPGAAALLRPRRRRGRWSGPCARNPRGRDADRHGAARRDVGGGTRSRPDQGGCGGGRRHAGERLPCCARAATDAAAPAG